MPFNVNDELITGTTMTIDVDEDTVKVDNDEDTSVRNHVFICVHQNHFSWGRGIHASERLMSSIAEPTDGESVEGLEGKSITINGVITIYNFVTVSMQPILMPARWYQFHHGVGDHQC